jgi:hypothetical protein
MKEASVHILCISYRSHVPKKTFKRPFFQDFLTFFGSMFDVWGWICEVPKTVDQRDIVRLDFQKSKKNQRKNGPN